MIFIICGDYSCFRSIDPSFFCQKMRKMFPKTCIIIILTGRKLCYTKIFVFIKHTCFWTCSTKRGARLHQLCNPSHFRKLVLFFAFLYFRTGCNQLTYVCQWRNAQGFTCINIVSIHGFFETETSHTRKVFNPYKIVKRRKPTHRAFFILCQNLLSTIYQCTSPPVWKSIRKASENILIRSRVLLTGIIVQIITKKQTTIVLQPLITITKSIAIRTSK